MEKHPLKVIREENNLSIDQLAAETGLSDRTIKRAEKWESINPTSRRILCSYFNKTAKELGLLPQTTSTIEEMERAMNNLRRKLITGTLVTVSSALVFPRTNTDIVDRVMSALARPSHIDGATLTHLETDMGNYWQLLPDIIGSSSPPLLKCVEDQLRTVMEFLSAPQEDVTEKRLWNLVGELTQIGGQMAFDMKKHDLAAAYYRSAINAAQLAGNDALTSVALTRMSFLPTYDKKPWEAIPYQEEAQRLAASSATPTTRAWIAAVTAEAHANIGNALGCQQALEKSEQADNLATLNNDPYRTGFDQVKVGGYKGACYLKIQQPERALSSLQSSLTTVELSRIRYQSILLTDIANAYSQQGEHDEATTYANKALTLTKHTRSANVLGRIQDFRSQLPAGYSAATDLDEQIRMLGL